MILLRYLGIAAIAASMLVGSHASASLIAAWNFNAELSPSNASTGTGTSSGGFFPFTSALPVMTGSPADTDPVIINDGPNNSSAARSGPQPGEDSGTRLFGVNTSLAGFDTPTVTWDLLAGYRTSRYYQITATTDGTNYNPVPTGVGSSVSGSFGTAEVSADGLVTVITIDNLIPEPAGNLVWQDAYFSDLSFTFPTGTAYDNNPNFGVRIAAVWDPNGTDFVSSFAATDSTDTDKGYIRDTSLGGNAIRYDLVRVSGIPEPTGLGLLAGCGLALLGVRRRK